MSNRKSTEIASLGEFGLIDRLTSRLKRRNESTIMAAGDDAAVIGCGEEVVLLTTDMMTEGIDFDLSYFPLKHLGYKAIVRGVNDILAMNGRPSRLLWRSAYRLKSRWRRSTICTRVWSVLPRSLVLTLWVATLQPR